VNEDEIPGALTDLAADIIVDALATDQETYDAVMSVSTGDEKLAAAQRLARQAVAARTAPPRSTCWTCRCTPCRRSPRCG
jgi:hypothetical protein